MTHEMPAVTRPWGGYTILKKTPFLWIKKLFIHPKVRCSLQRHTLRNEVWIVLSGEVDAQIGDKHRRATKGEVIYIPKKKKHRITGINEACILEVAFGRVLEKDIVRIEDDFGRQ